MEKINKHDMLMQSIANTCGELEREVKSRTYNVIEAFAVMTCVLVVLWLIIYPFGELMGMKAASSAGQILLGLGAIFIFFSSPFVHKDTLASWGLGNPVALYANIRKRSVAGRIILVAAIFLLIVVLTGGFYVAWSDAAQLAFGLKREAADRIQATLAGKAAILLGGIMMATFFSTCVIRYDNFLSALSTAFKIILVLGALEYAAAFALMGRTAFTDFRPRNFLLNVAAYTLFWGTLQQLLFSSYFGTRFRKGFAPARDPARRWQKRFWVAVLNGSFFGIIHINSWMLAGICWLLGTILSWVFMEDRNRNLVALGFIQGFLASSVGWLFDAGKAGGFRINMRVGPGHMKGFDILTMTVVLLLIAGHLLFIVYLYRKRQEQQARPEFGRPG